MHILLIEDSKPDADLIVDFITEENRSYEIDWVRDGVQALDYLYGRGKYKGTMKPDIILLDLALPLLSGYEVLKQIKQSPVAHTPVIVLTTSDNPVDSKNCLQLGAGAFFSKPYNLQGYMDLAQQLILYEFPRLTEFVSTSQEKLQ